MRPYIRLAKVPGIARNFNHVSFQKSISKFNKQYKTSNNIKKRLVKPFLFQFFTKNEL